MSKEIFCTCIFTYGCTCLVLFILLISFTVSTQNNLDKVELPGLQSFHHDWEQFLITDIYTVGSNE